MIPAALVSNHSSLGWPGWAAGKLGAQQLDSWQCSANVHRQLSIRNIGQRIVCHAASWHVPLAAAHVAACQQRKLGRCHAASRPGAAKRAGHLPPPGSCCESSGVSSESSAVSSESSNVAQLSSCNVRSSRLQKELQWLVALDVEYTHVVLQPGGRQLSLPAQVCLLDADGSSLLFEHCNPMEGHLVHQHWRHVGGLPPPAWRYAAPLSEVRLRLAALLDGRILVGHHLRKDLTALSLTHPTAQLRDTVQYRELQGRAGGARKLRELAAQKLGRDIQRPGRRHCPREDAQAALDLYLQYIHFDRQYMQYDDLVQQELADILQRAPQPSDPVQSASFGSSIDSVC